MALDLVAGPPYWRSTVLGADVDSGCLDRLTDVIVAALTGAPRRWIVYSVPIPVSDLIQRRYDSPTLLGAN